MSNPLLARSPRPSLWPGLLLSALFLVLLGMACGSSLDLPPLEKQAQAVDRGLICPVCPGETIDQSQVELAKQMRALVREKLQAGWTTQQVQRFFVERYGSGVLAAPPRSGFNIVAWIVPPAAVAIGAALLLLALRSLARRGSKAAAPSGDEAREASELRPYLTQVDTALRATTERQVDGQGEGHGG